MFLNKKRPINLDLSTLSFPPMAIVSIMHRISGIVLFILMPLMLLFLSRSLTSEDSFSALKMQLTHPLYRIILWVFGASMLYHVLAGIRHMIMDFGWGEQLKAARYSALAVLALALIGMIALGVWLC